MANGGVGESAAVGVKRRPLYLDDEYLTEVEGHGWYPSTRACTKMGDGNFQHLRVAYDQTPDAYCRDCPRRSPRYTYEDRESGDA